MPEGQSKLKETLHVLDQLRQGQAGQLSPVAEAGLEPQMALLRAWQTERLARTYADLLESPRYGRACRFFLSDIYAPRDFSQRDQNFERLHDFLRHSLPASSLYVLAGAIEANRLTRQLDEALLATLVNDLGMTDTITPEMYVAAYQRCDNYDERLRQIKLITEVGQEIDRMVRIPLTGLVLRLARRPARLAGWTAVQDFLERGHAAFKQMGGADTFLFTIEQRETHVLNSVFAGDPTLLVER